MQPAAARTTLGLPGSIAAQGNDVWVTGTFLGGFSNVGYYNYSTTAGASWVLDGPGTEDDVYECDGAREGARAHRAQHRGQRPPSLTRSAATAGRSSPTGGRSDLGRRSRRHVRLAQQLRRHSLGRHAAGRQPPPDGAQEEAPPRQRARLLLVQQPRERRAGENGRHDLLRLLHRGHPLPGTPDVPPLDRHAGGLRVRTSPPVRPAPRASGRASPPCSARAR